MENTSHEFLSKWWDKEAEDLHKHIFALIKFFDENQLDRQDQDEFHAQLYSNLGSMGITPGNYAKNVLSPYDINFNLHPKLNVIASVLDTIASKIAKNRPRIVMMPSGGDLDVHYKSKDLEKFVMGCFYDNNIYEEAIRTFYHACIFGTGAMKVFEEDGNITIEFVVPSELKIDDSEAFYGKPRQLHQVKEVDRGVILEMFPDHKEDIENAGKADQVEMYPTGTVSDNITVVESWHLPSGTGAKDGRHTICVDQCVLFDEEYKKDDFPFVFLRWKSPVVGFWGIGVVEDLTGIQVEINNLLIKVQKSFQLLSHPIIFIEQATAISKAHINDEIGAFVPYIGKEPNIYTPQTVNQEIFVHIERLYQKAFEIAGVSQLSAGSKVPAGMESGAALRELSDVETERFSLISQQWEEMFVKLSDKIIECAKETYTNNKKLSTNYKGKDFIQKIKWKDVDLDKDLFVLKVAPASSLPQTRAGKLQISMEMLQLEIMNKEEFREIIEIPDLESFGEHKGAARDWIKKCALKILKDGEYIPPDKYDDLAYGLEHFVMARQFAKLNDAPDDKIEMLEMWIETALGLMEQGQKEAQMKMQQQAMQQQAMMQQQNIEGKAQEKALGLDNTKGEMLTK